jgi:hypothetical protein
MANKKMIWGMLAMALMAGMALLACPNDTTEADTWTDVTSFDQVDGTWKGSYTQSKTMQELMGEGPDDDGFGDEMAAMLEGLKISISADVTATIDTGANTVSASAKITMTFSGEELSATWEMIKLFMSMEETALEINDNTHSITMTTDMPEEPIDETEMLGSGLQINQDGTKIKMPADLMEDDTPEMTMIKQ